MRSGRWGVSFTSKETAPIAEAAHVVGGYDELIRMERERRAIVRRGQAFQVVRDVDGRFSCRPAPPAVVRAPPPTPMAGLAARLRGAWRRRRADAVRVEIPSRPDAASDGTTDRKAEKRE